MPIPKNIRYDNSNKYTKKNEMCSMVSQLIHCDERKQYFFSELDTIDGVYRFVIQVESASNQDNRKTNTTGQ